MVAREPALRVLDADRATALERICELIVPGSIAVGPAAYIDALLARMPAGARDGLLAAIDELGGASHGGSGSFAAHAGTPSFLALRALAIEAYYSDFVAPGRDAPGAWAQIDFDPPAAAYLRKDWSYLGIEA
jgi:hypothetical protein